MDARGLNKSTLSTNCGVPYTTIDGLYKKGYGNAKLSTIRRIADYFGVSIDYLLLGAETDDELKARLDINYHTLSAPGKKMLAELSEVLVASRKYESKTMKAVEMAEAKKTPALPEAEAGEESTRSQP